MHAVVQVAPTTTSPPPPPSTTQNEQESSKKNHVHISDADAIICCGHDTSTHIIALSFQPDGPFLMTASNTGKLALFDSRGFRRGGVSGPYATIHIAEDVTVSEGIALTWLHCDSGDGNRLVVLVPSEGKAFCCSVGTPHSREALAAAHAQLTDSTAVEKGGEGAAVAVAGAAPAAEEIPLPLSSPPPTDTNTNTITTIQQGPVTVACVEYSSPPLTPTQDSAEAEEEEKGGAPPSPPPQSSPPPSSSPPRPSPIRTSPLNAGPRSPPRYSGNGTNGGARGDVSSPPAHKPAIEKEDRMQGGRQLEPVQEEGEGWMSHGGSGEYGSGKLSTSNKTSPSSSSGAVPTLTSPRMHHQYQYSLPQEHQHHQHQHHQQYYYQQYQQQQPQQLQSQQQYNSSSGTSNANAARHQPQPHHYRPHATIPPHPPPTPASDAATGALLEHIQHLREAPPSYSNEQTRDELSGWGYGMVGGGNYVMTAGPVPSTAMPWVPAGGATAAQTTAVPLQYATQMQYHHHGHAQQPQYHHHQQQQQYQPMTMMPMAMMPLPQQQSGGGGLGGGGVGPPPPPACLLPLPHTLCGDATKSNCRGSTGAACASTAPTSTATTTNGHHHGSAHCADAPGTNSNVDGRSYAHANGGNGATAIITITNSYLDDRTASPSSSWWRRQWW